MIRNSLPDKPLALEMISRSLATRPFPGCGLWGIDYYKNYTFKAETLVEIGRSSDAEDLLEEIIEEIDDRIEDNDLPKNLGPETYGEKARMEEMLFNLKMKRIRNR